MSHGSQADLKLRMCTEKETLILLIYILRAEITGLSQTFNVCGSEELNLGLPAHEARTSPTKPPPQPFNSLLTPTFTTLSRGKRELWGSSYLGLDLAY